MFLVTGATGDIGQRVVRRLRQQEKTVRSFVRLSSRYGELEHQGSEIFIGDLKEQRDIHKACNGVRYIISAHGGDSDALTYYPLPNNKSLSFLPVAAIFAVEPLQSHPGDRTGVISVNSSRSSGVLQLKSI